MVMTIDGDYEGEKSSNIDESEVTESENIEQFSLAFPVMEKY